MVQVVIKGHIRQKVCIFDLNNKNRYMSLTKVARTQRHKETDYRLEESHHFRFPTKEIQTHVRTRPHTHIRINTDVQSHTHTAQYTHIQIDTCTRTNIHIPLIKI